MTDPEDLTTITIIYGIWLRVQFSSILIFKLSFLRMYIVQELVRENREVRDRARNGLIKTKRIGVSNSTGRL